MLISAIAIPMEDYGGWNLVARSFVERADSFLPAEGDVHLYCGMPDASRGLSDSKFNVLVTVTDYHDVREHSPDYAEVCNLYDLLIVPDAWQQERLKDCGVKPPVAVAPLGHSHDAWKYGAQEKQNTTAMILDRGRDHEGGTNELMKYFSMVTYLDCRPDQPGKPVEEIRDEMRRSQVFFKWSHEGWCFPILEAMSTGCLVITDCRHLSYIQPDHNALVFDDVAEMHKQLSRAKTEPLTDIKHQGYKTAERLTWDTSYAAIKQVVEEHYR